MSAALLVVLLGWVALVCYLWWWCRDQDQQQREYEERGRLADAEYLAAGGDPTWEPFANRDL